MRRTRISKAKNVMAEVEGFCRHVARLVAEIDNVEHDAELMALIDEATGHIDALRQARINL